MRALGFGLILFLAGFLVVFLTVSADWVALTVGPIPRDADAYVVVAEDARGIAPLDTYIYSMFSMIEGPPACGLVSERYGIAPGSSAKLSVQWRPADRYGVLVHHRGGPWLIWWPGSREMRNPSSWRHLIRMQTAEIRFLPDAQAAAASPELLARMRPLLDDLENLLAQEEKRRQGTHAP